MSIAMAACLTYSHIGMHCGIHSFASSARFFVAAPVMCLVSPPCTSTKLLCTKQATAGDDESTLVLHCRVMGWTLCTPPMASPSHCSDPPRNSIWAYCGTPDRASSTGWGPGPTCLGQSHQSCPGWYVSRSVQKVSSFLAIAFLHYWQQEQ